jgi:trk system potassium uptake protein TrkH
MTLISEFESIPKSLLFWRSLSVWLGGMGILVFAISILPALGIGTMNLASAEAPGPTVEKIRSRMSDNAKILYRIYITLTFIEFVLLVAGPMDPFEAVIHAFGSMGNCGISTENAGIAGFNSLYVEIVLAVFCILASLNFISYQLLIQKRLKDFFRDFEIRTFFIILGVSMLLTIIVLWAKGVYGGLGETIRYGFFQVVSFVTTAGYSTADYNVWPEFCKWLLFLTIIIGGCSASTAGGIKVMRFGVMLMLIRRNIYKRLHPNAVVAVKLGGKPIAADKVSNITVFLMLYFIVFFLSCMLLSLDGNDAITTASASMASLSNAGLVFGNIGFKETMVMFSAGGRLYLAFLMIVGRLELFTILLLLTPTFWRPNR